MAGYLSGYEKVDIAILPQTGTAETAIVSRPYDMEGYDRAIFVVQGGSMGAVAGQSTSPVVWGRVLQGLSTSTGTFVALWSVSSFSGFKMGTTNQNNITNAAAVTFVSGSSHVTGDYITLWAKSSGSAVTYTFSTTLSSTGTIGTTGFLISASSQAENIMRQLVNSINDSTIGATGLYASTQGAASTEGFILRAKEAGEGAVNVIASLAAASSGKMVPHILEQIGYASLLGSELAVSSSYKFIMLELTPSSGCLLSATLVRGSGRYSPTQYVAGYKTGGAT